MSIVQQPNNGPVFKTELMQEILQSTANKKQGWEMYLEHLPSSFDNLYFPSASFPANGEEDVDMIEQDFVDWLQEVFGEERVDVEYCNGVLVYLDGEEVATMGYLDLSEYVIEGEIDQQEEEIYYGQVVVDVYWDIIERKFYELYEASR